MIELTSPFLLGGVQFQDACGVADQVRYALLDTGELGVELVPAGVIISDQVPGVALKDPQAREGVFGSGTDRGVVDQPRVRGAHGDRVRGSRHRLTLGVGVLTDHVGRGLISAQDVFGPQRLAHRLIEPGRG